ncbi:hypothetical protein CRYUN_Cryun25bG0016500 [Craigia yunnanensis]
MVSQGWLCGMAKCKVQDVRRGNVDIIDSSLDDELLSFDRCLRASKLVGLDCIEQYLPHRVALQFGMDQDIPGCFSRSNDTPEIAWSDYNKYVGGGKLYIPPRLFEADVTTQKERKKKGNNASMPHEFPPKSSESLALDSEVNNEAKNETTSASSLSKPSKELPLNFVIHKELNNSPFPPGFPPKGNMLRAKGSVNEDKVTAPVLPGFTPKCNVVEAKSSINEDEVTPRFPSCFPPKCSMVEAKGSDDENKVTPLVVSGIPLPQYTEVRNFVEDKVTETTAISASNHDTMGDIAGRNYGKSASHRRSLSLDSHEDQLTVAKMLKSNHKHDNC